MQVTGHRFNSPLLFNGLSNISALRESEDWEIYSLELRNNTAKIKRKVSYSAKPHKRGGRRGTIKGVSKATRQRFAEAIANMEGLKVELTLTYPRIVPNDDEIKKHKKAIWQFITRKGIKGIWIADIQHRGVIHFHCALTGMIDAGEIAKRWYEIVGADDPLHLIYGTHISPLKTQYGWQRYLLNRMQQMERDGIPEGIATGGKMWGYIGRKPEPLLKVSGNRKEMAPLLRVVNKYDNAKRREQGKRERKDGGRYGYTLWGVGKQLLTFVQRLLPTSQDQRRGTLETILGVPRSMGVSNPSPWQKKPFRTLRLMLN